MKKILGLKTKYLVLYAIALILGFYFLCDGLIKAKTFVAPLITAVVLSLIILPLTKRFENGMNRTISSLLSTLILVLFSVGLLFLIFLQVNNFTDSWPKIKDSMKPKLEKAQSYLLENTPITESDFNDFKEQISTSESGFSIKKTGQRVSGLIFGVLNFFGLYLLTFIYIFFILRYREKFKNFLLVITKRERRPQLKTILSKSSKVTTQYLVGKLILITLLSIVYSIGLGISGVSNFILVSIIAALLTLIPYIGNIIGMAMALAFGYLTTGNPMTLLGIIITFTVSQFLESYVLQPYVVGDKVNVHPFFTIVAVILGNFLWGVVGMVLAIPVIAIIAIVLKNIEELKPIGILLSNTKFNEAEQD